MGDRRKIGNPRNGRGGGCLRPSEMVVCVGCGALPWCPPRERVTEPAWNQLPCWGQGWGRRWEGWQPSVPIQLWAGRVLRFFLIEVPLLLIPCHDVQVVKVGVVVYCAVVKVPILAI